MCDMVKAIKGLEEISDYFFGVYHHSKDREEINTAKDRCDAVEDAIALLKENEAKSVESIQMDRSDKWGADLSGYCPSCKRPLKNRFNKRFCGDCGQVVTWDE